MRPLCGARRRPALAATPLGGECVALLQQRVGFGEGGGGVEGLVDRTGALKRLGGLCGLAESGQAAAVAEQRVGVFGGRAELLPALGGVAIAVGGSVELAACLGEARA